MKKKLLFGILLLSISFSVSAQRKLLVGGGMDVYRTDNTNPFKKTQFGMEVNYFILKNITLSGGMDVWSDPNATFLTFGTRIYPVKPLFIRFRGLVKDEVELSIGSGYGIPLGKKFWVELASDYYFEQKELGLRAGLAFGF